MRSAKRKAGTTALTVACALALSGCTNPVYVDIEPADEQGRVSPERHKLLAKLKTPVTFEFGPSTPLADAVAFLRAVTGVNMLLDRPALERSEEPVGSRQGKDVPLRQALERILRSLDLAYTMTGNVVFISTPEKLLALKKGPGMRYGPKADKRLEAVLNEPVSFCGPGIPLEDFAAFIQNLLRVNVVLDRKALARRPKPVQLSLRLDREATLKDALHAVCRIHDLRYTVRHGAIFITTAERVGRGQRGS